MALRSIPSHPLLALRLGPTIGMPIALLYMALLLVRGAELSMARAEKVQFFCNLDFLLSDHGTRTGTACSREMKWDDKV